MTLSITLLILIAGFSAIPNATASESQESNFGSAPSRIYWPDADPLRTPRQVGLLYTPEVLTVLAKRPGARVSDRISQAIRQGAAIVVMWAIPENTDVGPISGPFSSVIVEQASSWSVPRVEPVWVQQTAEELRQLDSETAFPNVGVVAAFPRSAFVPGRLVTIYKELPSDTDQRRGIQVFGRIEWNGTTSGSNGEARVGVASRRARFGTD